MLYELQKYLIFDYVMAPAVVGHERRLPVKYSAHFLRFIVAVSDRLYNVIYHQNRASGCILILSDFEYVVKGDSWHLGILLQRIFLK